MFRHYFVCLLGFAITAPLVPARADDSGGAESIDAESSWVTSIAPIGDSGRFVASTATGLLLRESDVVSFDPAYPDQFTKLYQQPAAVWCVSATTDGKTIASVDYRGNLAVLNVESGEAKMHDKAFERWCQSMLISPDNQSVVAGNEGGKVLAWSLADSKVAKSVELDGHSVTGLAFSPDGKSIAATDGGGHVHLLSWPALENTGKIEISDATAWCVAFVDDGKSLLVGSADRNLYRCEAKVEAKAESIAKGSDWITQLAVSADGQVAAGEVSGALHFPAAGSVDTMNADSGVWALAWNGSGQLLAGTRKHGIVSASRSWKWTPNPPPPAEQPEAKEAESVKPDDAASEEASGEQEAEKKKISEDPSDAEKQPEKDSQ